MANRSYLYSSNLIPKADTKLSERKVIGISEWNYAIPIVFKILVSGYPQACTSLIWKHPDQIALVADYAAGVKNLESFFTKVGCPQAQNLIAEAIAFLHTPENQNQYFVLECGEIFDMSDSPLATQNSALLEQVNNLEAEIDLALQTLKPPAVIETKPAGFFTKLFGRAPKLAPTHDPMQAIYALGLGNWSNILYFDFTNEEQG